LSKWAHEAIFVLSIAHNLCDLFDPCIFLTLLPMCSVILDLFIVARPAKLLHFLHPLLFGLWYLTFSVLYWAVGGTDPEGHHWIYPMVDWDRQALALGTDVGCIVG
jgi:hypothetical protein